MRGEMRLHGGRDQATSENRPTVSSSVSEDALPLLGFPRGGVAPKPAWRIAKAVPYRLRLGRFRTAP